MTDATGEETNGRKEQPTLSGAAVAAILRFHRDLGIDETVSETALDWRTAFTPGADRAPEPAPAAGPRRPSAAPGHPPRGADATAGEAGEPATAPPVMAARAEARQAADLAALEAILAGFEGCPLRLTARNTVFGAGNPAARVMFVGEAPGREEDLAGAPFVGRSGRLLERMLAAIGLSREEVFISNVLPWRPPANNPPSDVELATCLPFIERQIELVAPEVLVCLGGAATKALLGRTEGIKRVRGRWLTFETGRVTVAAMATLHPAYLLRQPIEKRTAWRDFLMLADRLGLGGEG